MNNTTDTNETEYLWRVDCEYLDCTKLERKNVSEEAPIATWIPVMIGRAHYAYFESEKEAKEVLVGLIDDRIQELQNKKQQLI